MTGVDVVAAVGVLAVYAQAHPGEQSQHPLRNYGKSGVIQLGIARVVLVGLRQHRDVERDGAIVVVEANNYEYPPQHYASANRFPRSKPNFEAENGYNTCACERWKPRRPPSWRSWLEFPRHSSPKPGIGRCRERCPAAVCNPASVRGLRPARSSSPPRRKWETGMPAEFLLVLLQKSREIGRSGIILLIYLPFILNSSTLSVSSGMSIRRPEVGFWPPLWPRTILAFLRV